MGLAKIKAEFLDRVIVFNGGGHKTLGERNDIDQLAIIAQESNSPLLKNMFEVLPSLDDLKKQKVDAEIAALNVKPEEVKVATISKVADSNKPAQEDLRELQDMEDKV